MVKGWIRPLGTGALELCLRFAVFNAMPIFSSTSQLTAYRTQISLNWLNLILWSVQVVGFSGQRTGSVLYAPDGSSVVFPSSSTIIAMDPVTGINSINIHQDLRRGNRPCLRIRLLRDHRPLGINLKYSRTSNVTSYYSRPEPELD
jgi:hypothetical protein